MSDDAIAISDMQAVIEVAQETSAPRDLNPDTPQALVIPDGSKLEIPDLNAWRIAPKRKTGVYKPATVKAFTDYVKAHDAGDATTIWVHPTSGRVVAVIDDNSGKLPAWGQHRADLRLEHTPEWLYWTKLDGHQLSQEGFAEHIESGAGEIEEPDAATVLEIAQTFHATNKASFRSSTRLTSGQVQFQYDNEVKASAGAKGELTIPTAIMLLVAPFIGETEQKVVARLRYRINDGALRLSYHLERPHVVIRNALDGVHDTLASAFPNVYVGEPAPLT